VRSFRLLRRLLWPRVHRHPAGAYVYLIDGSAMFGLGGREPVQLVEDRD
jgi:hypothetical protein